MPHSEEHTDTGRLQSPQRAQGPRQWHTKHERGVGAGPSLEKGRRVADLGAQGLRIWTSTAQKAERLQKAQGSQLMLRCPIGLPLKHTDLKMNQNWKRVTKEIGI